MNIQKNLEKQDQSKKDILNEERDSRCLPIALAVIKMFGEMEGHELLTQNKTKSFEAYNEIAQRIIALMLERNIPVGEYGYATQLVLKGFDEMNSIINESLNKHLRTVQTNTFGCQLHEMPMQKLHELLQSATIKDEEKS